jgi:hypothetical protein
MFIAAIERYHQYTQNQSLLSVLCGAFVGRTIGGLSVVACAACIWPMRRQPASSAAFGRTLALVLALTLVIIPMAAFYNQVLLAPAILMLLYSESASRTILPAIRLARMVGGILLVWPWIATVGLMLAYFWLTPEIRQRVWPLPFYSNFLIPVFAFGLVLLDTWTSQARTSEPQMSQP